MPLRTYACPYGHLEDHIEPVEAPSERPCDHLSEAGVPCEETAKRQLGTPGFVLKGPGFIDKGRPLPGKAA